MGSPTLKGKPKEAIEKPSKAREKDLTLKTCERIVEKLKLNEHEQVAASICALDGSKETFRQLEGLTALDTAIVKLLAELGEKGFDLEALKYKKIDVNYLRDEADSHGIDLEKDEYLPQKVALEKLDQIIGQSGPTSTEVRKGWQDIIKTAQEANKGWTSKSWEYAKKNPGGTMLLMACGAFGIYATYNLARWALKDEEADKKDGKKNHFGKKALAAASLSVLSLFLGKFLGKTAVDKILAAAGLDSDEIEDELKERGGDLSDKTKAKIDKAGPKAKAAIDQVRIEAGYPPLGTEEVGDKDMEEMELQEFGESLLLKNNAHKLDDGTYLITTGERETYFRFENGKWQWASEWQKRDDKWAAVGTSMYKDTKTFAKVNNISERLVGGAVSPVAKNKELLEATETISEEARQKSIRYTLVSHTITEFYCLADRERFNKIKPQILGAFEWMHKIHLSKILDAYKNAKTGGRKIPLDTLNINKSASTNEEALFHACAIVNVAFEESGRIGNKPDSEQKLEDFFNQLGKDPTLEVSNKVQNSIAKKMREMHISSYGDLLDAKEKVFDDKTIDEIFETNKEKFVEHLAHRYGIAMEDFGKKEKTDFLFIIASLYGESSALKQSIVAIEKFSTNRGANLKVTKATKKFVESLQKEVIEQGGILDKCIGRYDIEKPNSTKYNHVLKRYLKPELLHFKDGFQMALLSDGIHFDKSSKYESVGQAKDITMIYLMVNILKHRSHNKAYPLYVGNVINLASSTDVDLGINVNFKFITPYFKSLFGALMKNAKSWLERQRDIFEALEDMNTNPDKIKQLAKMDIIDFVSDTARSGARGAYQIPKDLVLALYGEFPDAFNNQTTGEDVLKMILSLGGVVTYPAGIKQGAGLVYLGGKYYFIKPIGILWDTAKALLTEGPGTSAKTYILGTSSFVVLGAGVGSVRAAFSHVSMLRGALRGTGRGLIAPFSMPAAAYRQLRGVSRASRYLWNAKQFRTVANLEMTGNYFLHYNDLITKESSGILQKFKGWRKRPDLQARKLIFHDIYDGMRLRWAHYFSINYNDFYGLDPELPIKGVTGESLSPIGITDKVLYKHKNFEQMVNRMNEVLENMRQIENMDSLSETKLFAKFKEFGLHGTEINTLKAKSERMGFEKFRNALSKDLKLGTKAKGPGLLARLRERLRKPTGTESVRSFGKASEALKNTQKELAAVQRRVAAAEKEIGLLNRMRKGPKFKQWDSKLQARLDTARQIIADGKAAEAKLNRTIEALVGVRKAEAAIDVAKKASETGTISSKYLKELISAQDSAEDALSASSKATKNIGKLGKAGSILKWGGRALGGIGVLFSAYEAGSATYEAFTTDVEGRAGIKGAEAALWTANVMADSAAVAVMFGSTGTGATVASAAALPLMPITYAGVTMLGTKYEETKKDYEWIQGNPSEALYHFYTSVNSISLGDAWITGVHAESPKERMQAKKQIMRKIFRGLVAIQKDPNLLNYINTEPPSKKKDKEVERLIAENYSVYHEFFFREITPTGMQSYGTAQKFILEAQMFDKIMTMRDQAKEKKMKFRIVGKDKKHPFSLHLDRYDVIGGMDNPKGRKQYNPSWVVQAYKEDLMQAFKKDEIKWDNLERMDTDYLLRLCAQIQLHLSNPAKKAEIDKQEGLANALANEYIALKNYLETGRGINFEFGIRNGELHQPPMSVKAILKHIKSIGSHNNEAFLDFEKDNFTITPALHALKRLAEYFGYNGPTSEKKLKAFFNEDTASYHGLYWDGKEWVLQERGWESDDEMGSALNSLLIKKIVARMREQPDNILEHRSDSIFMDAYDYEVEVKKMANILENGLKEGEKRKY